MDSATFFQRVLPLLSGTHAGCSESVNPAKKRGFRNFFPQGFFKAGFTLLSGTHAGCLNTDFWDLA
ncbi:hypothetical protein IT568_05340 [bacterium]|nr:hypothetical protein [bacterium]